jgi:AraC-like DNA-binding protein
MHADEVAHWWQVLAGLRLRRLVVLDRLVPWWDGQEVRRHSIPEVVVVLEGAARLETGLRQHQDLEHGDVVLVQPWVWFDQPRPTHGAVLNLGWSHAQGVVQISTRRDFWEGALPRALVEDAVPSAAGAQGEARRSAIAGLLAAVARAAVRPAPMDPALRRMCEVMWRHRTKPITATQVLAASGLGRTAAYALFGVWFGLPPKRLLLAQRLDLARRLLAEGDAVTAVARECGFRSRREFTRRFRLVHGHPPTVWGTETPSETARSSVFLHQPVSAPP